MLFADLLSLHLVTFLMFFILVFKCTAKQSTFFDCFVVVNASVVMHNYVTASMLSRKNCDAIFANIICDGNVDS